MTRRRELLRVAEFLAICIGTFVVCYVAMALLIGDLRVVWPW